MIQEICKNRKVGGFEEFEERVREYLANPHFSWLWGEERVLRRKLDLIFKK
jgi:hypothetical protein